MTTKIPRMIYRITLPSDAQGEPVLLAGIQEFSPGQSPKIDLWVVVVSSLHTEEFGEYTEFGSFDAACVALALVFFGGDDAALKANMVQSISDVLQL